MISINTRLIDSEINGFCLPDITRAEAAELTPLLFKYNDLVHITIEKPIKPGTEEQNRTAHALMGALFDSGMHSSPALTLPEFKLWAKISFGPCYDWEYDGHAVRVPKSWRDFNKRERTDFISRLLDYIANVGAESDSKIQQIIVGLSEGDGDHDYTNNCGRG